MDLLESIQVSLGKGQVYTMDGSPAEINISKLFLKDDSAPKI